MLHLLLKFFISISETHGALLKLKDQEIYYMLTTSKYTFGMNCKCQDSEKQGRIWRLHQQRSFKKTCISLGMFPEIFTEEILGTISWHNSVPDISLEL